MIKIIISKYSHCIIVFPSFLLFSLTIDEVFTFCKGGRGSIQRFFLYHLLLSFPPPLRSSSSSSSSSFNATFRALFLCKRKRDLWWRRRPCHLRNGHGFSASGEWKRVRLRTKRERERENGKKGGRRKVGKRVLCSAEAARSERKREREHGKAGQEPNLSVPRGLDEEGEGRYCAWQIVSHSSGNPSWPARGIRIGFSATRLSCEPRRIEYIFFSLSLPLSTSLFPMSISLYVRVYPERNLSAALAPPPPPQRWGFYSAFSFFFLLNFSSFDRRMDDEWMGYVDRGRREGKRFAKKYFLYVARNTSMINSVIIVCVSSLRDCGCVSISLEKPSGRRR